MMSGSNNALSDADLQRRAKRAAYMREWSRRRGVQAVKGEKFPCQRCGVLVVAIGSRPPKYCDGCRRQGRLEDRAKSRILAGHEPLGVEKSCKNCGATFRKENKRQFHCPPCSELAAKDGLPAYRKRQSAYQSARNKMLRSRNPAVAIRERMSAGVRNSLRDGKTGRSWETIVGYTVKELMAHLERQFLPGMTWDNRGEWHIDHIVPQSAFSFTSAEDEDFRACWALCNLRPMWAKDNIRKSAKRTHLI